MKKNEEEPKESLLDSSFIKENLPLLSAEIEKLKAQAKKGPKPELSLKQVALICNYTNRVVTRENGDDIAQEYGHTSGEGLFQRFTKYRRKVDRTGTETTKRKSITKQELIESILPKLVHNKKAYTDATSEMNLLKAAIENKDWEK